MKRNDDEQDMIDETDEDEEEESSTKEGNGELVKEAVSDLDKEIEKTRKEKDSLNAEIKRIDNIIKNAEEVGKKVERMRYQKRIARLDDIEGKLLEKRRKLQSKDDSLNKKLGKVKSIKEKLSRV